MQTLNSLGWAAVALSIASCSGATTSAPSSAPTPRVSPAAAPAASLAPTAAPTDAPTASVEPAPRAPAAPITEAPAPTSDAKEGSLLQRLMQSHFKQVARIRAAVISGNISAAAAPASRLTNMAGVDTLPAGWRLSMRQLQAASTRIHESADLPEAAAATADIAMACGGCHLNSGGPNIVVGTPPAGKATVAQRMIRHRWATERLWEGLYGPSEEAWAEGAKVLAEPTWSKDVVASGGVHARSLAAEFISLSERAHAVKGQQRASLYASLLATCAPCHAQIKRR